MNRRLQMVAIIIFCPVLCPLAFLAGAFIGAGAAIGEGIIKLLDADPCGNQKFEPANSAKNETLRAK